MPSSLENHRKRSFKQHSFRPLQKSAENSYASSSDSPVHASQKKLKKSSEFALSTQPAKNDMPPEHIKAVDWEEELDVISDSPAPQLERQDINEVEEYTDIFDDSGIEEPTYPDLDHLFRREIDIPQVLNHDSVLSAFLPYQSYLEQMNNQQNLMQPQMPEYILLYTPPNIHPANPNSTRSPVFNGGYTTL